MRIPYDARQEQFAKGNLVPNPSFEEGSIIRNHSGNTFSLRGWEKIGQNVRWACHESEHYHTEEVNEGRCAVKIVRERAGELDDAEGIISDYISVIPGNYYFTYNLRLKDIVSNKNRLGTRLYDAVVIKALFFDKDKKPVEPGSMNPVSQTRIDNSDKSYSFCNYWTIDDFPWGTVRGRTYNYPFSEGDIPDRTRYVRLFFGLKGRGTMWLDNIVYRYSKWNFSALERMKPYLDRQLPLAEQIIPTPKRFRRLNDVVYYDSKSPESHPPVIVVPENPAPAERTAAKILQIKISEVLGKAIAAQNPKQLEVRVVEKDFSINDVRRAKLVFSIGRNKLYQKIQPDLPFECVPEKHQGYVIKGEQIGNRHIIFLFGETPAGNFNAAATAVQLLAMDECVYHNATVIDYPDFLGRSYSIKHRRHANELENDLDDIGRMSLYKLNKVYFGYHRAHKNWYQLDALYREGVSKAGKICKESGVMSLAIMVNPYSHLAFEASAENLGDQSRYTWTHSDRQSFNMLKDVYKVGLEAGADTIMLLADDHVPHSGKNRKNYSLYTMEDKKLFVNLQNAQAHIINGLKQWIDKDYPGTRFEFCPPWYANEFIDRSEGKAEIYFKELTFQIPPDIAIIWTGPTVRSLSIDMADLHRYRSVIDRWPMIWDNTLYARNIERRKYGGYTTHYPGKVRMCNLFEPYDTYRPKDFQLYNHGRHMYTNGDAYREVYKIKYATVADYEWNTSAYNPERALWKVLCRNYGPACAQKLVVFNDAYYGVYEMCQRMEFEGVKDEYIKTANIFFKDLQNCLLSISQMLPEKHPLLKELENFRNRQKKRLEKFSRRRIGRLP